MLTSYASDKGKGARTDYGQDVAKFFSRMAFEALCIFAKINRKHILGKLHFNTAANEIKHEDLVKYRLIYSEVWRNTLVIHLVGCAKFLLGLKRLHAFHSNVCK